MEELNKKYITALDTIKSSIQQSDELVKYLEEEEDDDYKLLVQKFEPSIHELYEQVANENPLQLIPFEKYLLQDEFEGLYLPKVLGYSVLRGRINRSIKYYRPQNHFRDVLEYIINSSNFDQIKQRVGQSIQIGFALSSDIWITNIIEKVNNKKVKAFLQTQKLLKYRDEKIRNSALVKYRKQFQSLNFRTADFPSSLQQLQLEAGTIKDFLVYRALHNYNNESLIPVIEKMITNPEFADNKHMFEVCLIVGMYYALPDTVGKELKSAISTFRNKNENSTEYFFIFMNKHWDRIGGISNESEKNLSPYIDRSIEDGITRYYNMLDVVLDKGYIHEDALTAIRDYYYKNEGLSIENQAVRNSILSKLTKFLSNIEVTDYNEYFEINKTFSAFIEIFSNQKFNQDLKDLSLKFVRRCLKQFKDKRSKEYQDIKKFVKQTFVDFKFMTEKQVAEIFKTKRKPKTA